MNEAGEAVSNLPAILVLSMWWAFLSNLDLLFGPPRFGQAEGEGSGGADDADADSDAGPHDPRLLELVAVDPAFSAEAFPVGARRAYEEILRCYAGRELEGLRPLLSPEVLSAFAEACALAPSAARRWR
ncbi:MAG: TIM44-like domain-containing protein [Brucellaceae bacterium]|nr:TIM44-like domain-containing protein [Brucellaceae bacterium]